MTVAGRVVPWTYSVVVNLGLGYFATVPALFFSAGYDNDDSFEQSIGLVFGAISAVIVLGVFYGFNRVVDRRTEVPTRLYWLVSLVLLVAPTPIFILSPDLWQAVRWY